MFYFKTFDVRSTYGIVGVYRIFRLLLVVLLFVFQHSPPLIKGIDWIVSRPPNEVNFSTLNGKRMETGKESLNEIKEKRLRKKYRILFKYIENKAKLTVKPKF